jgi:hypothetical protein
LEKKRFIDYGDPNNVGDQKEVEAKGKVGAGTTILGSKVQNAKPEQEEDEEDYDNDRWENDDFNKNSLSNCKKKGADNKEITPSATAPVQQ